MAAVFGLRPTIAALLIVGASIAASPQVRVVRRGDERLAGIDTVDVVVRGLDTAPAACGVGKPALFDAATGALRRAGLRATVSARDSSWFYSTIV